MCRRACPGPPSSVPNPPRGVSTSEPYAVALDHVGPRVPERPPGLARHDPAVDPASVQRSDRARVRADPHLRGDAGAVLAGMPFLTFEIHAVALAAHRAVVLIGVDQELARERARIAFRPLRSPLARRAR